MIAIILRQPNGNGTYTARLGFVTGDTSVSLDGITCLPDYLESVSELAHRIDASRAMGAVPEPVEWSFDLIDWESTARRSVGILDGSVQLVGWVASLYVLPPGSGVWSAAILSETAFEVIAAPVTDGTISISCCERWVGNASTVGIGSNGSVVGIVVGGLDVTIKTNGLPDPAAIERSDLAGDGTWHSGIPGASLPITVEATRATRKDDLGGGFVRFWFRCSGYTVAQDLRNLINSRGAEIVATGQKFASALIPYSGFYASVKSSPNYEIGVQVTQDFYDSEAPEDVALFFRDATTPIAAGAASLVGWVDGDRTVTPLADVSVDTQTWVLSARPQILTADGFASLTRIDCTVGWADGATAPNGSTLIYYGNVGNVRTAGDDAGSYDTYNAITLTPTGTPSTVSIWAKSGTYVTLPLRLSVRDEDAEGFDGYVVDFAARAIWKNDDAPAHGYLFFPWSNQKFENEAIATGQTITHSPALLGPGANVNSQRFADIGAANAATTAGIVAYGLDASPNLYLNIQLAAIHLYGVSYLSPGSAYAVVTPGPAPWWTSQRTPSEAAQDLLDAVGFPIAGVYPINAPSVVPTVSQWGRSFEPNVTLWGAASEICSEFWLYAGRDSATIATAAADGEILGAPAFTLGDRNDTATELVIEYDEWAGSYRQRAYIAHVDEAYDYTNPGRYYGGFGAWGLNLWNACHAAWMHHGAKIERTIQMPSVRDPDLMGKLWAQSTRGGLARIRWASLQSRYVTFRIAETVPTWWAGDSVYIPTVAADLAGYDLTQYASVPLIVTSKAWDPMTLETTLEVALPPTLPTSGGTVIQQTFNAGDDLIQQTPNFTDNLIKQVS